MRFSEFVECIKFIKEFSLLMVLTMKILYDFSETMIVFSSQSGSGTITVSHKLIT